MEYKRKSNDRMTFRVKIFAEIADIPMIEIVGKEIVKNTNFEKEVAKKIKDPDYSDTLGLAADCFGEEIIDEYKRKTYIDLSVSGIGVIPENTYGLGDYILIFLNFLDFKTRPLYMVGKVMRIIEIEDSDNEIGISFIQNSRREDAILGNYIYYRDREMLRLAKEKANQEKEDKKNKEKPIPKQSSKREEMRKRMYSKKKRNKNTGW